MSLAIRDSEREKEGMNKLIEEPSDAIDPTYTSYFFFCFSISAHYSSDLFLGITSSEAPCRNVC
jgi:hypothetical protein